MSDRAVPHIPSELIEQVLEGNCLLFVGAGISLGTHGQKGFPSESTLATKIAKRLGRSIDSHVPIDLQQIAHEYELERGRQALNQLLKDTFEDLTIQPLRTHRAIAQL